MISDFCFSFKAAISMNGNQILTLWFIGLLISIFFSNHQTIQHNFIFFCFMQKVSKGFPISIKLVLSLIKNVNLAISASFIIFTNHSTIVSKVESSTFVHITVVIYKNRVPRPFPNCLFIYPNRKISGFNYISIFKNFCIIICS